MTTPSTAFNRSPRSEDQHFPGNTEILLTDTPTRFTRKAETAPITQPFGEKMIPTLASFEESRNSPTSSSPRDDDDSSSLQLPKDSKSQVFTLHNRDGEESQKLTAEVNCGLEMPEAFVSPPQRPDQGPAGGLLPAESAWLLELKDHIDRQLIGLRQDLRRDTEQLLNCLQQETAKRVALEHRFQNQLLFQTEMMAMELKLVRLEAKLEGRNSLRQQHQQHQPPTPTLPNAPILGVHHMPPPSVLRPGTIRMLPPFPEGHELMPEVVSGRRLSTFRREAAEGMSVASGVTFGDEVEEQSAGDDDDDDEALRMDPEGADSDSTPTLGSRQPRIAMGNLDSILLNPLMGDNTAPDAQSTTTRAVRGESDADSSLATVATGSTFASTIVTATTRGTEGMLVRRLMEDPSSVEVTEVGRGRNSEVDETLTGDAGLLLRSRSHSPLTVHSNGGASESAVSVGGGITAPGTVPVMPIQQPFPIPANRSRSRSLDTRPLDNRVVSFTTELSENWNQPHSFADVGSSVAVGLGNVGGGGGDSVTMPDELDNLSESAENFASSMRRWREDYEARLDAIQKRWASE